MARTRSAFRRPESATDLDVDANDRLDALLARATPPAAGPRIFDEGLDEPWTPDPADSPKVTGAGDDADLRRARRRDGAGPREEPGRPDDAPALFTLPTVLRGATTRPGAWAVIGMAVVVVVAAAIFGLRVWRAEATSAPAPIPTATRTAAGTAASMPSADTASATAKATRGSAGSGQGANPTATTTAGPGGAPGSGTVVVQVAGEVARPSVVSLPSGSRVVDAVTRCGGTTRKADVTSVNMARPLTDGEQIVIVAQGAPRTGAPGTPARGDAPAQGGVAGRTSGGASSGAAGTVGPVDLNTADATALQTLPGVGPVLAQRILEWRTQHGRFSSVDELGEVTGVGEKTLERLTPLVKV